MLRHKPRMIIFFASACKGFIRFGKPHPRSLLSSTVARTTRPVSGGSCSHRTHEDRPRLPSAYRRMLLERLQLPSRPTARRRTNASARRGTRRHRRTPGALEGPCRRRALARRADHRLGPGRPPRQRGSLRKSRAPRRVRSRSCMHARQTVVFHTALALLDTRSGHAQVEACVPTHVRFRELSDDEIRRCRARTAARLVPALPSPKASRHRAARSDGGDDPTALIGLPLIAFSRACAAHGLSVLP